MDNPFKANLERLTKFAPDLVAFLCKKAANAKAHGIELISGKDVTLAVDGIQLTSRHNRTEASQITCSHLNFNEDVHLYGLGLGDEARLILKKLSPHCRLFIHVLCPVLFYELLNTDDEITSFLCPRLNFIYDEDPAEINNNAAIVLSELVLEPDFSAEIKSRLINLIDRDYAALRFEKTVGLAIKNSLIANSKYLAHEKGLDLASLKSINKALVLGSGPSLQTDLKKIIALKRQGYCLIAVDTAMHYLEEHGVVPDFIVSIDEKVGKHAGIRFLKDLQIYRHTILIFAPWSNPKLYLNYPGPRFYIREDRAEKILPGITTNADRLWHSGSVSHAAVSLAVKLNATEIVFSGMDLCFYGDHAHAGVKMQEDPYLAYADKLYVQCNDHKRRITQKNFNLYREELEDYIAVHRKIKFKTLSEHAAVIRGCSLF